MSMGYFAPTRVIFGAGVRTQTADLLKKYGAHRVLIHFGGGSVRRTGLLDQVEGLLKDAGIEYAELGGAVPNPRVGLVREGAELVRKEGLDFILAVGGGSVIDSAKAIGYGAYGGGDVWDFYCGKRKVEGTVPVGAILTLAATGTEMSDSSVITNDELDPVIKKGTSSDFGRIKFAIMDPELTYSVSAYQTASGSTDIMMHTMERFFPHGSTLDFSDELSVTLLREVIKWTPVALEEPDNYEARANLMWCGSLSHNGLMSTGNPNRGDWASHQMEHELSAEYDVAHGAGLSALWGSWARYVLDTDPERFSILGQGVFRESDPVKTIELFEDFFRSIGMPVDLNGLGLSFDEEDCRKAALNVTFQDTRTIGNFKVLNTEDVFNIYMLAAGH